jgi:putative toxin-antitoxin system antitoxin component (TIGR02293 family)
MSPELLAERVFGDKEKAKAWLNRPNPSLSDRRPIDLLQEEAGTAIIHEMLQQIDHGIFD